MKIQLGNAFSFNVTLDSGEELQRDSETGARRFILYGHSAKGVIGGNVEIVLTTADFHESLLEAICHSANFAKKGE